MQAVIKITLLLIFLLWPSTAWVQSNSEADRLELDIYKLRVIELERALKEPPQVSDANNPVQLAYKDYAVAFYKQEAHLRAQRVLALDWQVFAANIVLALVVFISIAGVIFSGFQLWIGSKSENKSVVVPVHLEISMQRIKLQSSVIGIVILVISCVFLLLFIKDVYSISTLSR